MENPSRLLPYEGASGTISCHRIYPQRGFGKARDMSLQTRQNELSMAETPAVYAVCCSPGESVLRKSVRKEVVMFFSLVIVGQIQFPMRAAYRENLDSVKIIQQHGLALKLLLGL